MKHKVSLFKRINKSEHSTQRNYQKSLLCGAFSKDWITLWRVSGSQMQRLTVGLTTRVTEWKMMAHAAQEPRLEDLSPLLAFNFRKSKAEIRRLEERRLLCSSHTFYTNGYQRSGRKQGTSQCPAAGWEGSEEHLLKEAEGWWPSQAAQVRSVCRGFRLMCPSQNTLLLWNAACRLWSLTDAGTKSDVLQSN